MTIAYVVPHFIFLPCALMTAASAYCFSHRGHLYYFKTLLTGFRYHPELPTVYRICPGGRVELQDLPGNSNNPSDRGAYHTFLNIVSGRFVPGASIEITEYFTRMRPDCFGKKRQSAKAPLGFDHVLKSSSIISLLSCVGGDIELLRRVQIVFTEALADAEIQGLQGAYLFFETTDRGLRPFVHAHLRIANAFFNTDDKMWQFERTGPRIDLRAIELLWHRAQATALRNCKYIPRFDDEGRLSSIEGLESRAVALIAASNFACRRIAEFLLNGGAAGIHASPKKIARVGESLAARAAHASFWKIWDKLYAEMLTLRPLWLAEFNQELAENVLSVVREAHRRRHSEALTPLAMPTLSWRQTLATTVPSSISPAKIPFAWLHRNAEPDREFAGENDIRWHDLTAKDADASDEIERELAATVVTVETQLRRALLANPPLLSPAKNEQDALTKMILQDERRFNPLPSGPDATDQSASMIDPYSLPRSGPQAVAHLWNQIPGLRTFSPLLSPALQNRQQSKVRATAIESHDLDTNDGARVIASTLTAEVSEVIFPSQASQAVNLALIGLAGSVALKDNDRLEQWRRSTDSELADALTNLTRHCKMWRGPIGRMVDEKRTLYAKQSRTPPQPEAPDERRVPLTNRAAMERPTPTTDAANHPSPFGPDSEIKFSWLFPSTITVNGFPFVLERLLYETLKSLARNKRLTCVRPNPQDSNQPDLDVIAIDGVVGSLSDSIHRATEEAGLHSGGAKLTKAEIRRIAAGATFRPLSSAISSPFRSEARPLSAAKVAPAVSDAREPTHTTPPEAITSLDGTAPELKDEPDLPPPSRRQPSYDNPDI